MTSPLTPEDFDDLHTFIEVQVAAGFAPIDEIVEDSVEALDATFLDPTALYAAARAIADQATAAHRALQREWPATTDCDKLDAAFADLEDVGILARQHFSCCATCGREEIHEELEQAQKEGQPVRGFTFFHVQDTEQAIAGELLYLSYGSSTRDQSDSVAIGHEVVAALGRHGLAPAWNGKIAHRIALPLTWQRRRP